MTKRKILVIIFLVLIVVSIVWFVYVVLLKQSNPLPALLPPKSIDNTEVIEKNSLVMGNFTGIPLTVANNIRLTTFAKDLGDPRVIIEGIGDNCILVSLPKQGKVVCLKDEDENGVAEVSDVLTGLNKPHGLATRSFQYLGSCRYETCILYVAEEDKVSMYAYDLDSGKYILKKKLTDLPKGGNHTSRSLLFIPGEKNTTGDETLKDGTLLVSIGSSCNVCNESDSRRGAILAMDGDGSNIRTYATGLRNTVFMTQGPDEKIYGTDMGRDLLGDDLPPEEINIIQEGKDYGWPVCYGNNIHDTNFDKNVYIQNPCTGKIPPIVEMQAHSAPLGIAFFPDTGWGDYAGDMLVAFHGSWNRSIPTGYKIVRVHKSSGKYEISDFISGWLPGTNSKQAFGRPVGVYLNPGGVGYITDDKAGVIYQLQYAQP